MTLICLGDSLTYGFGIPRHRVWPSLLAKTTGMKVLNWGINGDLKMDRHGDKEWSVGPRFSW